MDRKRWTKRTYDPKKGYVLQGWRYGLFIAAVFGSVGLACYPIWFAPSKNPEQWKAYSAAARKQMLEKKGLTVEDIQPSGMKVWSDPWDRPGKPGNK